MCSTCAKYRWAGPCVGWNEADTTKEIQETVDAWCKEFEEKDKAKELPTFERLYKDRICVCPGCMARYKP
jgi:hypothetical protein